MKLIALPDLHAQTRTLERMGALLAEVDYVLLAGDLTNGSLNDARQLVGLVQEYNPNVLAVPGNMDNRPILAYLEQTGINLHAQGCEIDGVAFAGVGGSLPFAGSFVFEEDELAGLLAASVHDLPPEKPLVLVCHQPPISTANDRLDNGQHVGSKAVRTFIEAHQPMVCFTGHVHEGHGIDRIGDTQIINPGPLWRGDQYAYAEINGGQVTRLEIRKI